MSETNGINGHNRPASGLAWKVGLLNSEGKYLTSEKFGKVNVTGTSLKKKQIWTLEQVTQKGDVIDKIYIRNSEGKYLATEKNGDIKLFESPEEADEGKFDADFVVEYPEPGSPLSGRWLFRSDKHGSYLGIAKDKDSVKCFHEIQKSLSGDIEHWTVQLSMHPQLNIQNVFRKGYAHLCNDELQCNEEVPWGSDALVILEFIKGKYAIKTSNNKYLKSDGSLEDSYTDSSLYNLEIKAVKDATGLAFKDRDNKYLTAIGSTATMKAGKNKNITKDELFIIRDSHPQVVFISDAGKKVSIKQGVDVSANQTGETEDTEMFQLEYQGEETNKWAIRTCNANNPYWTIIAGGGIQAKSKTIKADSCLFDLEWQGDGKVKIKAPNGKYITHKQTGALIESTDSSKEGEKENFSVKIINRPLLVLRGQHGFVGLGKGAEYNCNKANYDMIFLEGHKDDGTYTLKGENGKFWSVADDKTIVPDGDGPTPFVIEFHKQTYITIKAPNGNYLKGQQSGLFKADGTEINADTLWEF